MRELFSQIKLQFLIFHRNNLVAMIFGITAFYLVIIYFTRGIENIEKFVTLLIFNDPAMIGFIFIGLSIILEKDQEVLIALFTTPINLHVYLWSRIIALTSISLICCYGMVLMAYGTAFNVLHFSVGAISVSVIMCFVGIFVVSFTTEILHFLLRSVPLLILMSLPLANYFELTDLSIFKLFPVQGSLYLIANSYSENPVIPEIIFGYFATAIWIPVLYWIVFRTFRSKLVNI